MKNKLSTLIMTNSDPEYVISDDMRDMIVRYMEAVNADNHSLAEELLYKIQQENRKNGSQD